MVGYVQPISHILATSIYRYGFLTDAFQNHNGNKFFRELIGPVIVGTIGYQDWQSISVIPGPD
jgi:hypothetical protein